MADYQQGTVIAFDMDIRLPYWISDKDIDFTLRVFKPNGYLYSESTKVKKLKPEKYGFLFSVPLEAAIGTWEVRVQVLIQRRVSGYKIYKFNVIRKAEEELSEKVKVNLKIDLTQLLKKKNPKSMNIEELEYWHITAHKDNDCSFHREIAEEMLSRGYPHIVRDLYDEVVELLKKIKVYNPRYVINSVLRDDWRIIRAWLSTLNKGKKFTSSQFKGYNLEQQKQIVRKLGRSIRAEMKRRGWKPSEKGLTVRCEDVSPITRKKVYGHKAGRQKKPKKIKKKLI